jgi:hypothetical protein
MLQYNCTLTTLTKEKEEAVVLYNRYQVLRRSESDCRSYTEFVVWRVSECCRANSSKMKWLK